MDEKQKSDNKTTDYSQAPIATPNPQPKTNTPLNQTSQPSQNPSNLPEPGFSQSDMLAIEKKKHRKKMMIIFGGIFLGLAVLAVLSTIVISNIFGLKTITYDNGSGDTYKLSFYNKYAIRDNKDTLINTTDDQTNLSPKKALVSQVSHGNKGPVVITIDGVTAEQQDQGYQNRNCTDSNVPEIFKVHNDILNQDISVCRVGQYNGNDALYAGLFEDAGQVHVFLIRQDVDINSLKDEASAKAIIEKVGLQEYTDDIKEILASVHVSEE